ncbi:hypothetical protein SRABI26_01794 [Arthrobacter sp. Bi26]|nr:hypothetical protein SRABI26_01794 [Arthrobacter sp. Bi26]
MKQGNGLRAIRGEAVTRAIWFLTGDGTPSSSHQPRDQSAGLIGKRNRADSRHRVSWTDSITPRHGSPQATVREPRNLLDRRRACCWGRPHTVNRGSTARGPAGGEGQQDLQGTLISRRPMLSDLWPAPNMGGRIPGWVVSRPRQEVSTFSPRQAHRRQLNDLLKARDGAPCHWQWLATPSTATIFLAAPGPQSAPAPGGSRQPAYEDSRLFAVLPQPVIPRTGGPATGRLRHSSVRRRLV